MTSLSGAEGSRSSSYTATYSPDDNKLRLRSISRLPKEVYERVHSAGFRWASKQDLFVAPMWTPEREDVLLELCGSIDDEDQSLTERAATRAERFETYSDERAEEAQTAREAVSAIVGNVPMVSRYARRRKVASSAATDGGIRSAASLLKTC